MARRMTGKLADPEFRRARARKAAAARNSVENHARHVDAAVAAGRVDVLDLMPAVRRVFEARFAADLLTYEPRGAA